MYRSDSELIYKIPPTEVKAILQAIVLSRDPQYLELLRSMCKYGTNIIYHNQRIIIAELFQNFIEIIVKTSYKAPNGKCYFCTTRDLLLACLCFFLTRVVMVETERGLVTLATFALTRGKQAFPPEEINYLEKLLVCLLIVFDDAHRCCRR